MVVVGGGEEGEVGDGERAGGGGGWGYSQFEFLMLSKLFFRCLML